MAALGSKRFLEKKEVKIFCQGTRIAVKTVGTLSMIALFIWQVSSYFILTCIITKGTPSENIARGTTDPGIASITWIISPATKQANSLERKIQVKHSIGSNFGQMTLPALVLNLPTRWRHFNSNWTLHWFQFWTLGGTTSISSKFTHQMVTKCVHNSSYKSNAWVRCASGNVS